MFHKILAPLDGSPLAERSLPYVEALAQQFNAEVVLGWVVQIPIPATTGYGPELRGMGALFNTNAERERATAYLLNLQEELSKRQIVSSTRIVESISVSGAIVDMAFEEEVDLIVKTTYARLGISRWLQGNIAAEVLQHAPCPLLLVKVSDTDVSFVAHPARSKGRQIES
ncbi:MAG: universal stress protein [Caldilineaceae bacterium]|nr:universal stress protein [Caldilineaceae bacterium]